MNEQLTVKGRSRHTNDMLESNQEEFKNWESEQVDVSRREVNKDEIEKQKTKKSHNGRVELDTLVREEALIAKELGSKTVEDESKDVSAFE